MKELLKQIWLRLMPTEVHLPAILWFSKRKMFWIVEPYMKMYLAGSKYDREHTDMIKRMSRIYIGYDGALDGGREAHEIMSQRGWLWSSLWMENKVHPDLMWEMCIDHPEKFPVERLLFKWQSFKYHSKQHVKENWYWYVIYLQLGVFANVV